MGMLYFVDTAWIAASWAGVRSPELGGGVGTTSVGPGYTPTLVGVTGIASVGRGDPEPTGTQAVNKTTLRMKPINVFVFILLPFIILSRYKT
jgi:hypothetical protein